MYLSEEFDEKIEFSRSREVRLILRNEANDSEFGRNRCLRK